MSSHSNFRKFKVDDNSDNITPDINASKWVIPVVFEPVHGYATVATFAGVLRRLEADLVVVCVLALIQEEGLYSIVHLPETVQVCQSHKQLLHSGAYWSERVGDIVDVKANGAVQKGSVRLS